MDYEAIKVGKIDEGDVYQVDAPLDKQLRAFQEKGIHRLVTSEQVAKIRLQNPNLVSDSYTRTCVAPIGVKGEPVVLHKQSPLMNTLIAAQAVAAHKKGEYPLFSRDVYDFAIAEAREQEGLEPEDRTAFVLLNKGDFELTPEMPDTRFLLGRQAQEYFKKFHSGKTIPFYNLQVDDIPKGKSAVNYLWFGRPAVGSGLTARGRGLSGDNGAFGVLKKELGQKGDGE